MREVAEFFKALSDEARVQMLWLLMSHRELCVCDFMEVLGITQSKASRHLRKLYHAELVDDRRQGQWVYYTLRRSNDRLIRAALRGLKVDLGDRAEAVRLLEDLDAWMRAKARADAAAGCQ